MAESSAKKSRDPERRMSLGGHLKELRNRVLIAGIGILLATGFGWWVSDTVFVALQQPITAVAAQYDREAALNFDTIAGSFDLRLQIAFTVGLVVSSPLWLYELWAFLSPGLVKRERWYAVAFILVAVPLFLGGAAVGWMVMPHIVDLFLSTAPEGSISNLSARYYMDFIMKLMIATGIGFVLPALLTIMNFAGLISGRTILKGWRVAVIVIVVFTAFATPATDIMSMFLLAVPIFLLYLLACAIALINDRRRAKREARMLAEEGLADVD